MREITDEGRKYHRLWVERVFEPSLQLASRRPQGAARHPAGRRHRPPHLEADATRHEAVPPQDRSGDRANGRRADRRRLMARVLVYTATGRVMPTRRSPPRSPCATAATRSVPHCERSVDAIDGSASPRRRSIRASKRSHSRTGRRARRSAPSWRHARPWPAGALRGPRPAGGDRGRAPGSHLGRHQRHRARPWWPRPPECRGPTTCRYPHPASARGVPSLRPRLRPLDEPACAPSRRRDKRPQASLPSARSCAATTPAGRLLACRRSKSRTLHRRPAADPVLGGALRIPARVAGERAARRPRAVGAAGPRAGVAGRRGAPDRPGHRLDRVPGRRRS